jgi:hypothetical protein
MESFDLEEKQSFWPVFPKPFSKLLEVWKRLDIIIKM